MENVKKEILLQNLNYVEQFAEAVVSYTSRYNNKASISYSPENVTGKTVMYPCYGDYPDTFMMRSYGTWLSKSEGIQSEYMPQDVGPIITEDYIIVKFQQSVIPTSVKIYETYNPGAIVRIWGIPDSGKWSLLWEGQPRCCDEEPTIFSPSLRITGELIQFLRIDFNQSLLKYNTALDAILLAGHRTRSAILNNCLIRGMLHIEHSVQKREEIVQNTSSCFSTLPYELIVYIFSYLDLRSLCSCAQVNRFFYSASNDSVLYQQLCFKRYAHLISDETLDYFIPKCKSLRKLDMSWCGQFNFITEPCFIKFLTGRTRNLTNLSTGNCPFVQQNTLELISNCDKLVDLRLRNCWQIYVDNFLILGNLRNLQSLDLYSTNIDDQSLARILKFNSDLKHLNIDLCEQLLELDFITEILSLHNKKLRTLSCWKTHSLTPEGVKILSKCSELRELDFGYCLMLNDPGECLFHLAQGCPYLTRLILSCWRGLYDHQLIPIIRCCPKLEQLDLLGVRNISGDICEVALDSLSHLKLLDVSFCAGITTKQVNVWRQAFPQVVIQRSCDSNNWIQRIR